MRFPRRAGWFAFLALSAAAFGQPDSVSIRNDTVEVTFDPSSGHFAVSSVLSKSVFLTGGQFDDAGGVVSTGGADDPVLGHGRAITVLRSGGGSDRIELYPGMPFALFRVSLHNTSFETKVIRSIKPLSGFGELGLPAQALTTLGTGGLLAPGKNPGSYMWLALADPVSRKGIVAGWLTSDRGSGVVFSNVVGERVSISAQIDYGKLNLGRGKSEALETFAVGYFDDARRGLEAWADTVARVYKIKLPPQPVVYCTWYAPKPYGAASDEAHLSELADFAAKNVEPYGLSVIQIDDHWQDGISHDGPKRNFLMANPTGPYPHGMKAIADKISSLGMKPGLWFLPFAGTSYDPVYKDHQDWFVKTAAGKPYEVRWGGTCLDLTYPPALEHVAQVVNRIVHEWDFKYIKIDGLWTGTATKIEYVNSGYKDDGMGDAVFSDPKKTNVEAFRDGLKLVRKTAGPDVFIDGCNTPQNMRTYGAAMGLVDGMRVGPDNKAEWVSMLKGPTFGSRQYFLNGRVWYNDPDPIYVRPEVPLSEARTLCSWAALTGQMNTSSEWYPGLPADRLDLLRRTMPTRRILTEPVDLFEQEIPRIWLLKGSGVSEGRNVVGYFNWSDKPAEISCPLDRLGFAADAEVVGYEFWGGTILPPTRGILKATVAPRSCQIFSLRTSAQKPQILGTSRHVTQGLSDVQLESWDTDSKALSGYCIVTAGDRYEIRVASAGLTAEKAVALVDGAVIPMECHQEGPLVRAAFVPRESGAIGWKIQFR